jgi:hypothetical protein
MAKLWVFLLATAPCQLSIFWGVGWQAIATFRERRIARAAAAEARALVRSTKSPKIPGNVEPVASETTGKQSHDYHGFQPQSAH